MEFIIRATTNEEEYTNAWDNSSCSSEVTAIVYNPDPNGLANLCNDVDELNIIMNMLVRPNLTDIIRMFGRQINLEEMYLVASYGEPSAADVEEFVFSKRYALWTENKYHEAQSRVTHEHRLALKQYITDNGDGYSAMLAIAKEKFLKPVSREFYENLLEKQDKKVRSHPISRTVSEEELTEFIQLFTIEQIFMLYGSYSSEEAELEKARWYAEMRTNRTGEPDEYDDGTYSFVRERDITIAPFKMPTNGVLVLSDTRSSSCYCD